MDIYKYQIWTGHIPGLSSTSCARPSKKIVSTGPNLPDDCTPCTTLSMRNKIDACVDCANGLINVCCPNPGESCCGIILNPCDEFYSWSVDAQNKHCSTCPQKSLKKKPPGFLIKSNTQQQNSGTTPKYCECCNRTQRESEDSTLTIFLDHDFNDMGHYTMWDGQMGQEDTFSNSSLKISFISNSSLTIEFDPEGKSYLIVCSTPASSKTSTVIFFIYKFKV